MPLTSRDWRDRAACLGQSDLFTVKDHKKTDQSYGKWTNYDREAIKKARRICRDCPVFYQCEADASPEDFRWTVRAGRMPDAFNTIKIEASTTTKQVMPEDLADVACVRGHIGQWHVYEGRRVCRECRKNYKRE